MKPAYASNAPIIQLNSPVKEQGLCFTLSLFEGPKRGCNDAFKLFKVRHMLQVSTIRQKHGGNS